MSEQERGFAPTDPSVEDDLLAPEPKNEAGAAEKLEAERDATEVDGDAEPDATDVEDEAERPRRPGGQFVRIGWALVVVVAVVGASGSSSSSGSRRRSTTPRAFSEPRLSSPGPGTRRVAGIRRTGPVRRIKQLKKSAGSQTAYRPRRCRQALETIRGEGILSFNTPPRAGWRNMWPGSRDPCSEHPCTFAFGGATYGYFVHRYNYTG